MPWSPMLSHWHINVAMSTRAQGNGSHAQTTRRHPQDHRCLIRLFNNLSFVEQQLNYISHDHRHAITSKVLRASFSEGDPVYRDCDLPSTSSIAAVFAARAVGQDPPHYHPALAHTHIHSASAHSFNSLGSPWTATWAAPNVQFCRARVSQERCIIQCCSRFGWLALSPAG